MTQSMTIEPLINEKIKTTFASKIIFFLLCTTLVWTTLIYGAVHNPIIAIFYIVVVLISVFWIIDAFISKAFRFNKNLIQLTILATAVFWNNSNYSVWDFS